MARDPYRYFRVEARELVDQLMQGVLELADRDATGDGMARLLRLAHTLKGAARVVKLGPIAERAHALEETLAPLRGGGRGSRAAVDAALADLDSITAALVALDATPPEPETRPSPAVSTTPATTAAARPPEVDVALPVPRASSEDTTALLDAVAESRAQTAALRRGAETARRARELGDLLVAELSASRTRRGADASAAAQALAEDLRTALSKLQRDTTRGVELVDRELEDVRAGAERLTLQAASSIFTGLDRVARHVAQSSGVDARFHARGGEVRVDASLLGAVQQALVQLVRNAVAHGIEPERERRAAGKPPTGRIDLQVERRGARVAFVCTDDGRGVDVAAVRRVAARSGVAGADTLDPGALLSLLARGGLSTSPTISESAGRGVGLDVVRDTIARLNGQLAIRTDAGRGTTVELVVPLDVAAVDALIAEAGGRRVAIPLDVVRSVQRVPSTSLARSGSTATLVVDDRMLPFAPLAALLDSATAHLPNDGAVVAVLMEGASTTVAVGVDRLLGTRSVVVRPPPRLACIKSVVSGMALDTDGLPQIVVDADAVAALVRGGVALVADAQIHRLPVLVVDDSLTTRMLEQSILESAGYEVRVAASAEEALERAQTEQFALVLVDVEMPGMDGFTFVASMREHPTLRDVPAILVTSRASAEDKRRGEQAGARDYVVKSEFDQARLLARIRELVA